MRFWAGNQQSPGNGDWEKQEEADFHWIVAWDKLAETCHQFLRKGRKVYVEGYLQTRTYKDKAGVEKSVTEIVVDELVMLDSMPKDVRQTMDLQDALTDTANSVPAPQV